MEIRRFSRRARSFLPNRIERSNGRLAAMESRDRRGLLGMLPNSQAGNLPRDRCTRRRVSIPCSRGGRDFPAENACTDNGGRIFTKGWFRGWFRGSECSLKYRYKSGVDLTNFSGIDQRIYVAYSKRGTPLLQTKIATRWKILRRNGNRDPFGSLEPEYSSLFALFPGKFSAFRE